MAPLKQRSLIKLNLKFLLDYEFLRDGRYTNVASGQQFYDGGDTSRLLCDTNADDLLYGLSDGQVWQSAFRNWVYESGVALNDAIYIRDFDLPTVCSGVYVSGTFYATDPTHPSYDANVAHHIDWTHGRVIFDNAIPTDALVQAQFAYKHIRVAFDRDFNRQFQRGFLESKYTTNPLTSSQLIYPSGGAYPFPASFIEINGRTWKPGGYELGNRSLISNDTVTIHVYTLDEMTFDDVSDLMSYQARKNVPLIDFNVAPIPLSGLYHEKSPNYIAYQELLKNPRLTVPESKTGEAWAIGGLMYFDAVDTNLDDPLDDFERGRVVFTVEIYNIMPNSPIRIDTGVFDFRGGTENF